MNDVVDDLLHTHGKRWVAAQSEPPSLEIALRKATATRDHRARTAVAMIVVAVVAVASIPLVRSLVVNPTHRLGTSQAPSSAVSSVAPPPASGALPTPRVLRVLTERAHAAAIANQDPQATAEAVRTTYIDAERIVLDGDTSSNPPGDTQVWVIQLHGDFTCAPCKGPVGADPTGAAVALVINARTYAGYGFAMTKRPHDLTSIGTPIQLPM